MSALFLDSNILVAGLTARWGLSRAVLSLCAARIHELYLAETVIHEVERSLLILTSEYVKAPRRLSDQVLSDYDKFILLSGPKIIPKPSPEEVEAASHLIRHQNDVPVPRALQIGYSRIMMSTSISRWPAAPDSGLRRHISFLLPSTPTLSGGTSSVSIMAVTRGNDFGS